MVVEKQALTTTQPEQNTVGLEQEDAEEHVPLGSLETKAEFEELVVWGHETMADEASDPYVRIEEWTRFAEQVWLRLWIALPAPDTLLTRRRYIHIQRPRRRYEAVIRVVWSWSLAFC